MVASGDLIVPLKGFNGKVVAFTLLGAGSDGDLVIPLIGTDGKVVAMKVIPLTSEGDEGLPVAGFDGIVTPVTSGGDIVFAGNFFYTDTDDNIFDVGFVAADLEKIGENEGFSTSSSALIIFDILSFKGELYVCGSFSTNQPSTRSYNNIAKLNQDEGIWELLAGTDLDSDGFNMCVFEGELIIIGLFEDANSATNTHNIATWDGTQYSNLGDPFDDGFDGPVACATYKDELWVSGFFLAQSFDQFVIFTWTGGPNWNEFVQIFDPLEEEPLVMMQFRDDMYTGADTEIYKWDGVDWTALSLTANNPIFAMTVFEDSLIMGGRFTSINATTFKKVVRWDGTTFSKMGEGFNGGGTIEITDLHVNGGKLYAIGSFSENGEGDTVEGLAVWNPTTEVWDQVGDNTNFTFAGGNALATFTGKLDGKLPV